MSFIKEFFYFQKSDRKVILFLLVLIGASVALFQFVGGGQSETRLTPADSVHIQKKMSRQLKGDRSICYDEGGEAQAERFFFDPNTADSSQLLRLGLSPWQVRSIYRYRAKGGIYRKPSDFARLYGLTVKQYRELEPYIRISSDYQPAASLYNKGMREEYERDTVRYPVKIKGGEKVSLNEADSSRLKKVPGIGSGWARRILSYRERLGGFYSVSQLKEIDGFPEESLPYFEVRESSCRKLNVNRLTLSQLQKHPYLSFFQARAIVDYRRLKGKLKSLSELKLLKEFPPEAIRRLEPYVEY